MRGWKDSFLHGVLILYYSFEMHSFWDNEAVEETITFSNYSHKRVVYHARLFYGSNMRGGRLKIDSPTHYKAMRDGSY